MRIGRPADKRETNRPFPHHSRLGILDGEFMNTQQAAQSLPAKPKSRITEQQFLDRFREKNGDKYTFSPYVGYRQPITLTCPDHGDCITTPFDALRSYAGCKQCGEQKRIQPRISFDEFVKRAIKIHGDKYVYHQDSFVSPKIKMRITCPDHGDFEAKPRSILTGYGCRKCGYEKVKLMNTVTTQNFILKAQAIHGDRYDYSQTKYIKAHDKVAIGCAVHGLFYVDAYAHLNGYGCRQCGIEKRAKGAIIDQESIISRFRAIHGDLYDYSKTKYAGAHTEISIICKRHGEFSQLAAGHTKGHGCPKCSHIISNGEQSLAEFVGSRVDIITNTRAIITPYELDIYIPSKSIAIEYNGINWHSEKFNDDSMKHQKKHLLCKDNWIRLIQIWEDDWKNKRNLVESMIDAALGNFNKTIYARNTVLTPISGSDAKVFFEQNHLNGFRTAQQHIALKHHDEIVMAASFSKPSVFIKNKHEDMEIVRMASLQGCRIVGGLSKILSTLTFNSLLTYADALWYDGQGYKAVGFEQQGLTEPGYAYVHPQKLDRKHRFSCTKQKIEKMLENYDATLSEKDNMALNNYYRLYDAGHYRFVLHR